MDEKLTLASLYYEGVANAGNSRAIRSLLARRLVQKDGLHLEFHDAIRDPDEPGNICGVIEEMMPRKTFLDKASRYHNTLWRSFRAPFFLTIIVFTLVLAYLMKDQMPAILQTFAAVSAIIAAAGGLLNRFSTSADSESS